MDAGIKTETLKKGWAVLRKNWPLLLILAAGVTLLLLPAAGSREKAESTPSDTPQTDAPEETLAREEERLAAILAQVEGAGQVRVLLTWDHNGTSYMQQDKKVSDQAAEQKTVVLKTGAGEQTVCIRREAPVYRGAIVVAQGAGSAEVRLALTRAVSAATGLGADKISVMKMQVLGGQE